MAEDLGNTTIEALLTEFTELVNTVAYSKDGLFPGDRIEGMAMVLEEVTTELKIRSSELKTAIDAAKQMAEKNEQLEESKRELAKKNEELDERRKQIETEKEQLSRRTLDLEAKERLLESRRIDLEKKEELLQRQSVELNKSELAIKEQQARLEDEAAVIQSNGLNVERAYNDLDARTEAARKANLRKSNEIRRREDNLKVTHQSVFALNEAVNRSLAEVREKHDEDQKLRKVIDRKYQALKQLRTELLQKLNSWLVLSREVRTSKEELVNFEAGHREILAGLRKELESVSMALEKQTNEAMGISTSIEAADSHLERLLTSTDRHLGGISTKIGNVGTGLDEVSTKIQGIQPMVTESLGGLTEAISKARANCQRSHIDYSVSRFKEVQDKRKQGPTTPDQPLPKRQRLARSSSAGGAEIPTSFGRPEPLSADIEDRFPSPRYQGRVVLMPRREDESSPIHQRPTATSGTASTPSGGCGPLGSSIGSQDALYSGPSSSSIDPATTTEERSSQSAMTPSGQSGVSAINPPRLSTASDEVKCVWRQIEFPEDWNMATSNLLLAGLNRAAHKKNQPRSQPAGLLDGSSAQPNCFLCRVSKMKSTLDNGDGKSCSNCKTEKIGHCVRVSFVAEGLAEEEYDRDGQGKRWKLSFRED